MRIMSILVLAFLMPTLVYAAPPTLKSKQEYQQDAQNICTKKWSTRGELDRRMYNHCMEQQTEGYKDLVHLQKQYSNQGFYADVSFPYCRDKWTERGVADARMMVHCLKQEVEGMLDVAYYREKYGAERVDEIARRAIGQFKSWNMAAYRVKQQFD
jgi:hypothetical protein